MVFFLVPQRVAEFALLATKPFTFSASQRRIRDKQVSKPADVWFPFRKLAPLCGWRVRSSRVPKQASGCLVSVSQVGARMRLASSQFACSEASHPDTHSRFQLAPNWVNYLQLFFEPLSSAIDLT